MKTLPVSFGDDPKVIDCYYETFWDIVYPTKETCYGKAGHPKVACLFNHIGSAGSPKMEKAAIGDLSPPLHSRYLVFPFVNSRNKVKYFQSSSGKSFKINCLPNGMLLVFITYYSETIKVIT